MSSDKTIFSSFRDPSGFLFTLHGEIYRQVNSVYGNNYDLLINSGLYTALVEEDLLVPHEEMSSDFFQTDIAYTVIKPRLIPFISYPYEWCFSQLKQAALTTLKIQKKALEFNMTLKDASAYNIQFQGYSPVFIDTLSFEKYTDGQIWFGYRQFCQHFLAPLALMCHTDIRLNQLSRLYIDGVPLDLASKLLPLKTKIDFSILSHIHLHAKSQQHFADKAVNPTKKRRMSKLGFMGIIDSLESGVKKLKWNPKGTEWGEYYEDTNYSQVAMAVKEKLVSNFLGRIKPKTTWDLGANRGLFSLLAAKQNSYTLSFDIDPAAVEKNYLSCKKNKIANLLPLILDLTNPSGGIGWANQEREALLDRGPADAVLSLALIHHLAISNNLPFKLIADFLKKICRYLIIEFVPKIDSQVQRLLATREDIFPDYTQSLFEQDFSACFNILSKEKVEDSHRSLYLMEKKSDNN